MFETLLLSLGIGVISSQGIAIITSLSPVGAWIAKSSGDVAKSIVVSETTNVIKKFFQKRIAKKQLQDIYIQSVQAILDDTALNLDDLTRANLVTTQHTFRDFLKFVDTYNQLNELPFKERRDAAQQILREYIQKYVPEITDAALDKIEEHFSKAAFRVIDDSIKKSPEAFYAEGLASLNRIEAALKKDNTDNEESSKNLEILKATALYYQNFAPEINVFGEYLSNIDSKIDDIRKTLDIHTGVLTSHGELLGRIEEDVGTIRKTIEGTIGKSQDYAVLTEKLTKLEKIYDALPESNVQLRLEMSKEIEDQKTLIHSFEQDVIWLAETFKNNPIDSERLRQAQMQIEVGELKRAAELLNAKDLEADQQCLLTQKEESKKKQEDLDKQLHHNAMEYLVKAQVTTLNYSDPKRFDEAEKYYLLSIRSFPFFDNLYNYASFLQSHCQFNDAESVYVRIIDEFKEKLRSQDLAKTLHNLAVLHVDKNEYETAEREYIDALAIYQGLAAANPPVYLPAVALTLNNLASLHADKNKHETAEREYNEALMIYRDLANANPAVYLPTVAMTLNNLAILHKNKNKRETAEREHNEALTIMRDLANAKPALYLPTVAGTLNNLANLHIDKNEYEIAEGEYNEALTVYRDLANANPAVYLTDVAMTLNNLAILYADKYEYATAEREYNEALMIYRNLANANPAVYLPAVALTLNNLANLQKSMGEHEKAEIEYTEALTVNRDLATANPAVYLPAVAGTLHNLASLHVGKNEHATARREYNEALTIYRDFATVNWAMYLPYVATTLNNLANLHKNMDVHEKAERKYTEALTIRRGLANVNPAVYLPAVAGTLNNLAILHMGKNDHVTARREFNEALTIFRNLANANPAVYLPAVVKTLNNLVNLYTDMKEYEKAKVKYTEAQEIQRNLAAAKDGGISDCDDNSSE